MKEDKIPYLVENKERDTFTFYIKGTKPYLELQQRINKAIEYIKEDMQYDENIDDCWVRTNKVLEILGDKENE